MTVVLIVVFLALRLWNLEERINFSMDQGMFMQRSWEIWKNKELTLLGPPASPLIDGRHFFQGPVTYYLLVIMGILTNWDPIKISWLIVLTGLGSMYCLYKTVEILSNKKNGVIAAVIFCLLPVLIKYSNFIWNPNFLLLLTPLYLWLSVKTLKDKQWVWGIATGVIGGIGLQFHFQFGLITLLSGIYLLIKNKRLLLPYLMGLVVGYLPLIIFDLRNNFYNVKTIILWLTTNSGEKIGAQWHYGLSYIVILIVPMSIFLNKINPYIKWSLLGILLYFSIKSVMVPDQINGINYVNQNKIVNLITENGCPKDFNVASTIDGDTRAHNLRYLLTIKKCPTLRIDEYPRTKTLFLVAPPERLPETETVWEVKSAGKFKVVNKQIIGNQTVFYELGF